MNVNAVAIAGQQSHDDTVFPYVMMPHENAVELTESIGWVSQQRHKLLGWATQHGAVLLRRFAVTDAHDFDVLVQALALENFPYKQSLSNAVRINRTDRVFSANEAPPEAKILFHHEMAQTPLSPKWILFSCEVAPQEGGATPLCRSDILYNRLKSRCPDFIADCESKGLIYTNVMPGEDDAQSSMGRSWRSTLGVETKYESA